MSLSMTLSFFPKSKQNKYTFPRAPYVTDLNTESVQAALTSQNVQKDTGVGWGRIFFLSYDDLSEKRNSPEYIGDLAFDGQ